jgi:hypothetical protein
MSENPKTNPGTSGQCPDPSPNPQQLGRRLFVFKAAAVLGGVAASAAGPPGEALADPGSVYRDYPTPNDSDKEDNKGPDNQDNRATRRW